MRYMIKATLASKEHPEYGVVDIAFPILREEYDRTIELVEGDPLRQDCLVVDLDSHYSVLKRLEGTAVNVDELDYLAKRLESFSTGEDAQFQAMASKLNLSDIQDLINLTFSCQQATVITDFANLEQTGKSHSLTVSGGSMPMDEFEKVDGLAVALDLIQSGAGVITPYGVVYNNGMKLEQAYDGQHFPLYFHEIPLLNLEIKSEQHDSRPEYLYLPASDKQIERTLLRAGITDASQAVWTVEMSMLR